MTYLILFYVVLALLGGIVLYAVNSRASKKKETNRKESTAESNQADSQNISTVSLPRSSDVITDAEYREVLRKRSKTKTEAEEYPAGDSLKYSDKEYREVLRKMHQQPGKNKGINK
ncbi:MAG: hypothetical protein WB502_10265 [Thermoactinomyces sp.]